MDGQASQQITFFILAFITSQTMSPQYNSCSCFIHNVIYILVLQVQNQTTNTKTISPNCMEMSEKASKIRFSAFHHIHVKLQNAHDNKLKNFIQEKQQ